MTLRQSIAVALVTVVAALSATPVFAQQPTAQAALKRKGDIKVWIGAGLMGAGAFTVPATVGHKPGGTKDPNLAGVGLLMAGSGILWWGFHDKRRAAQPSTTVGVAFGRVSAVQIRRSW